MAVNIYDKHEKSTINYTDYPYWVIISNFYNKDQIYQKLEVFFETKRVPRLYKTLDIYKTVQIMFQIKVNKISLNKQFDFFKVTNFRITQVILLKLWKLI